VSILDIPVPPSVNTTRRINRAAQGIHSAWEHQCDVILMASGQFRAATKFPGPFELDITLDEQECGKDLDNPTKHAVDYLRRIELITDDSPQYFRRLTVQWGDAPKGCRLEVSEPRTPLMRVIKLLGEMSASERMALSDILMGEADVWKSYRAALAAVQERVRNGGPGWEPK
jgi:Holliday junction resolvase RusA-like endonuclease